jgi:hypothetical protein
MKFWPAAKRKKGGAAFTRTGPQNFWEDPLVLAHGLSWRDVRDKCKDRDSWSRLGISTIETISQQWNLPSKSLKPPEKTEVPITREKREKVMPSTIPELQLHPDDQSWDKTGKRFRIVVDCQVLAGIVNGAVPLKNDWYRPMFRRMGNLLDKALTSGRRPAWDWDDPVCWRARDWNRQADFVVNVAMDANTEQSWSDATLMSVARHRDILIFCDGGLRRSSMRAAAGWVAYVAYNGAFHRVAYRATPLEGVSSAFQSEAIALENALEFLSGLC